MTVGFYRYIHGSPAERGTQAVAETVHVRADVLVDLTEDGRIWGIETVGNSGGIDVLTAVLKAVPFENRSAEPADPSQIRENFLPAEHVATLYELNNGQSLTNGWTKITTQHIRNSRWLSISWLVLREPSGWFWGIEFGVGLTERQEGHDLPWEQEEINGLRLTRLWPHQVTTTEYRTEP